MKTKTPSKLSKFPSLASALIVAAVMVLSPTQTRANTIALDFIGGELAVAGNDLTAGWAFTLTSAVLLTDLGIWDLNNDGLNTSHLVTIWTSTGTFVTSATVPSATSGTLVDDFRYISIAPTLLAAGDYVIGAFYSLSFSDPFILTASTVTPASGVTYTGSRLTGGNNFPPTDQAGFPNSYFGPNFQFTVPDSGSTFVLMLGSVAALLIVARLSQAPLKI